MPQISLTDFVDVVSKSGTPKATKISQIKHRPPYQPAFDFYRPLRELIIETHVNSLDKKNLTMLNTHTSDPKKEKLYPDLLKNYKSWWGKKAITWQSPPSDVFSSGGIDVSINPELGLEINGELYFIKLYFKKDKLTKQRIDIITHLMDLVHGESHPTAKMSVLDVNNKKLFANSSTAPLMTALVHAELAYIATIWPTI